MLTWLGDYIDWMLGKIVLAILKRRERCPIDCACARCCARSRTEVPSPL